MRFSARAIEIKQGGRVVYVSSMTIKEVDDLLPTRVENEYDVVTDTNRAVDARHIDRIGGYIEFRPDGGIEGRGHARPGRHADSGRDRRAFVRTAGLDGGGRGLASHKVHALASRERGRTWPKLCLGDRAALSLIALTQGRRREGECAT